MNKIFLFSVILCCLSCAQGKQEVKTKNEEVGSIAVQKTKSKSHLEKIDSLFKRNPAKRAFDFDFPIGKPNAKGYYNAQQFGENDHLGDDWNGTGGGNSDLGDPIYSIGNGYITFAEDYGAGWGKLIRITHSYEGNYYESLYAHCDSITIQPNTWVNKGDLIATIGNADGAYWAHLHLEIRDIINMDVGGGYSADQTGYLDPTSFIKNN